MNVLMISTDKNILVENSSVRKRMIEYGTLFESLRIIVFCKKGDYGNVKENENLRYENISEIKISENTFIYPTNSKSKLHYLRDTLSIGKRLKSLNKKMDYISTQDPFETAIVGSKLAKVFGAKLQIQIHTDLFNPAFKKTLFRNRLRVLMARHNLPKANAIRVVSERIKRSLKGLKLKTEAKVLPIFVPVADMIDQEAKFSIKEKYAGYENYISLVSRLEKEKGVLNILEAIKKLPKDILEQSLFVFIGDGSLQKEMQTVIDKNNLSKNIVLEGRQEDVNSYLKTSDIFLQASYYEGYGMSLIEAAAAGLPIISTDVGIVGDVLKENESVMVTRNDPNKIAEKIVSLLEDKELQKRLSQSAKNAVLKDVISREEYLRQYKETFL